ncbi:MAG: serine hydrolase [Oscillospiraceae bacterium]|jgi:D-alanyl-D-alanine carboxypeptidase (penicillin-binding protein 5/6)|nr:serine hydrolase [Oscillospiraceae bacterium]
MIACGGPPSEDTSSSDAPEPDAASAAVLDAGSGELLYELRADSRIQPGSLTKLMPVYILFSEVEAGSASLDDTVTVSARAAGTRGSAAGLPEGAALSVRAAVYGILLPSGGDAAIALSEFLCGSEEAMVDRMNDTASGLGMGGTRFADCTGLSYEQLTTSRDMAIFVTALLGEYPEILDYTKDVSKTVTYELGGETKELELYNTNRLLGSVDGVCGLKTGTVGDIHNVIIVAERAEKRRAVVVLGALDEIARWQAARQLTEYGFTV